jgi:glycosyltransferase involved in cell wall biosynthesis
MRICYFGDFDPNYSRTRTILMGLERIGVKVVFCNERKNGIGKYWRLWKKHRKMKSEYDVMVIGYGDSRLMPLFAKLITSKPVVWEALFSKYDNWVFDRKLVKQYSIKSYMFWFTDWLGSKVSDLVLLDTKIHTKYFNEEFGIPERKLSFIYVGADTTIFYPRPKTNKSDLFEVEFHGKYFPMQGTDVVVRAAKLLEGEKVHFTMIGSGQESKNTRKLAEELGVQNVTFHSYIPQSEIVEHVRNADVCIGLIGDVPRVIRAIPTKLWEAAAMEKVTINASPGSLEEVFTPGVDTIGLKPGDHKQLADIVLDLMANGKAEAMGKAANATFQKYGKPEVIGQSLLDVLKKSFPNLKS